ncbi:alginate export family protein [Qipengyuania vesicularis]|uniref:alginate export family protein n=1 Tax=Qipengyuania vesicularis TaxID=2867232 RepID=UPI001C88B86B|nr:alginate export family protein [Qipengyuania vesicularis]MBX7527741.1 alginate export family protein [Qipengyuania vesicularis]
MNFRAVACQTTGPRRSLRDLPFTVGLLTACLAFAPVAHGQDEPPPDSEPVEDSDTQIKFTLEGGINAVAEENLYWNLADRFAPSANFDSDTQWLEVYAKPGVELTHDLDSSSEIYGGFSVVASATLGTDAFDQKNTGRVTIEEAFLGFRTGSVETGQFDLSIGAQELKLGTGMLISNGASNGFERGAVKLGPRKAWERTIIARFRRQELTATAFLIDPNELASNNTKTHSVGGDIRLDWGKGDFAGVSYVNVLQSGAPYPQAAPGGIGPPDFLDGGREGLNAVSFYSLVHPAPDAVPGLYVGLDGAYQWNDRISLDAWGGRIKIGHAWNDKPWRPDLFWSYQTFSGDDPDTPELERFDPLNYEGSPASWATGSKAALVFINSNVQSHQLTLRTMPSPKDFLTLRAAHIRVNEQRSPIQFGQATRLEISDDLGSVISGVTANHLADDFFVEYTRVLTPNIFLTGGFSISIPGEGIENAFGGDAPSWTGGFVNVVVNF